MRVTNLEDAEEHIGEVLKRVKKEHLERAYKIKDWYGIFYAQGILILLSSNEYIWFPSFIKSVVHNIS